MSRRESLSRCFRTLATLFARLVLAGVTLLAFTILGLLIGTFALRVGIWQVYPWMTSSGR